MFWFSELCPALLAPIAVHSPVDLIWELCTGDAHTIEITQLLQTLEATVTTGDSVGGHTSIRTGVLSPLNLLTAGLEKVLDTESLALQVILENVRLVSVAKDTVQACGLEIKF